MADTLLLVDDDAAVLRAIGDYFERIGYEVWRDGTGEQAIETYRRGRPPVVLLALHLPGARGLVVLGRPRRAGGGGVPFSGPGGNQTGGQAGQPRAAKFFHKPAGNKPPS